MGFDFHNRWAVVTGASSGIGKAIAKALAMRGCHLFLVARRDERLQEIALHLSQEFEIQAKWCAMDLTQENAAENLAAQLKNLPISIVVNNAGFAVAGSFNESEEDVTRRMIALNITFLTMFCRLMLPRLEALPEGGRILNVGSIAGYQGVPNLVAYAATKAFVNHFSEGLAWEQRASKVHITSLEPGQTASEFFEVAGATEAFIANWGLLTPDMVANTAIRAMIKGKPRVVVGMLNKVLIFSLRFTPRWMVRIVIDRMFKDMA